MSAPGSGWLRVLAAAVLGGVLLVAAWGIGLAVRGGLSRLLPSPQPRLPLRAFVVREMGSGKYLFYTEVQLRPGDLFISPADQVYRIERVGFDTAWARLLGPRDRVLGRPEGSFPRQGTGVPGGAQAGSISSP